MTRHKSGRVTVLTPAQKKKVWRRTWVNSGAGWSDRAEDPLRYEEGRPVREEEDGDPLPLDEIFADGVD